MTLRSGTNLPGTGCPAADDSSMPPITNPTPVLGGAGQEVRPVPDILNQLWQVVTQLREARDWGVRGLDRPYSACLTALKDVNFYSVDVAHIPDSMVRFPLGRLLHVFFT